MNNSIADSDSIKIDTILVPHSNAISLLTHLLNIKKAGKASWLDLACGKGQILNQLGDNLDKYYRSKIDLHLVDLNNESLRCATDVAHKLGLSSIKENVSDIAKYCNDSLEENTFDFITFINTFHEIKPCELSNIITSCLCALKDEGVFYLFDQEKLTERELGAVTWSSVEVSSIINDFLRICELDYCVYANKWNHKSISSWSIQIQKTHILNSKNAMLREKQELLTDLIKTTLKSKADANKMALVALTRFGGHTENETENKIQNLFDYWALSQAMETFE
jgi:ubiquinone/menaquinone biosynthesis C-methylase UbiE